jgi:pimeloyl-ACP methyl ester carboxylesterase
MPTVELPDVTIAYDIAGDAEGEPIVLICGCGAPAVGWFALVQLLAEAGYRILTFDNRGMPPSSSPPAPYSIGEMVADTLGLCDHLGLKDAIFVGHSMGGWIAEVLAADHPERVRAAAFLGSCNVPTSWEVLNTTAERDIARLAVELPSSFAAAEVLHYLPNAELQRNEVVDAWTALLGDVAPWQNPGRLGQYEACLEWSLAAAQSKKWPSVRVPCLVLAFEHDIDSPPQRAREAAAQIPGAVFVEIPDASHLGPFTHPNQVTAALLTFLDAALRSP